jgi:nucleoid-associated protein EbfC
MKGMNFVKQAQEMMAKLNSAKEELARRTEEVTVGGGMVKVVARGDHRIVSIKISKDAVDPDDVEMLEDLVVSAVNEGLKKVQEMIAAEMSKLTGGMNIPGLF